ncbi:hypothetical protein VaNZ11_012532, partial [Volvox africanus]
CETATRCLHQTNWFVCAHAQPGQSAGQNAGERAGQNAGERAGQNAGERAGQSAGQGASSKSGIEHLWCAQCANRHFYSVLIGRPLPILYVLFISYTHSVRQHVGGLLCVIWLEMLKRALGSGAPEGWRRRCVFGRFLMCAWPLIGVSVPYLRRCFLSARLMSLFINPL